MDGKQKSQDQSQSKNKSSKVLKNREKDENKRHKSGNGKNSITDYSVFQIFFQGPCDLFVNSTEYILKPAEIHCKKKRAKAQKK